MRFTSLLGALAFSWSGAAAADAQSRSDSAVVPGSLRTLGASRLVGEIRVDGRLDESAWMPVDSASGFVQSWPNVGSPATERSVVRVLYDESALFVGIRAYDQHPDSIAAQLARRDATGIYSDWLHVMIDSYHDRRTAFRFSVNPRGVKKDVYTFNDSQEDLSWDAVWEVATTVDSLGWTAEFRIPFSQLRFGGAAGGRVWGFQVQRDIARRDERDSWSPWTRQDPGLVSRFGDLTGLVGVSAVKRLELMPYASTRLTRAPNEAANPLFRRNDGAVTVGADLKAGLPKGLTLSATVNPDFGQVEADPAVVNLTAFETFFEERRPFFVEDADVFRFGQTRSFNNFNFYQYFYSRRIGRSPQRGLFGPDFVYVDAPDQTNIAVAAKVSGKTPGGWSVGLLDAVTTRQEARFIDAAGAWRRAEVEPLSNYFVGRLRKDLRQGQSVVGGMFTATQRNFADTALASFLRHDAEFGGLDFQHAWANRAWVASGFVAGSRIAGERGVIEAAQRSSARYFQRPDADYLEVQALKGTLTGSMGELALAKVGGGRWIGSVSFRQTSPGFELNDAGFLSRADARALSSFIRYGVDQPTKLTRNYGVYAFTNQAWNFGRDVLFDGYAAGANAQLANFWNIGASFRYTRRAVSDRLTRGGPLSGVPTAWQASLNGGSDSRRPLTVSSQVQYGADELGGSGFSSGISLDLRPASFIRLSIGPGVEVRNNPQQYIRAETDGLVQATFGRRYVFADLHQTTFAVDTRLDWTFTPALSLQLYAQPFVSAGAYARFKELLAPRTTRYGVYGEDVGTINRTEQDGLGAYSVDPDGAGASPAFRFSDPDFNFRSLRGNAVLRWEYRPGSTLFAVWQQLRSDSNTLGNFDFARDTRAIFDAPGTNIFLVKASYWVGR